MKTVVLSESQETFKQEGAKIDSTPPLLEVRGLTKGFAGQLALDEVDLTVQQGSIHALLGENGAGKSTLIKIVAGALKPDGGVIMGLLSYTNMRT